MSRVLISVAVAVAIVCGQLAAIAEEPAAPAAADLQMLGDGDQKLHLVDHDGTWSIHAEGLVTYTLLDLWHQAGGPLVVAKIMIDRPFTISVHKMMPERILERLLEGYSYTLHYDAVGKLRQVRVYSPEPALQYKTARLVESLAKWREAETAGTTPAADATETMPAEPAEVVPAEAPDPGHESAPVLPGEAPPAGQE